MSAGKLSAAARLCRENDLLPTGSHVLCAVSGGADSMCLLHWLNRMRTELGITLTAAHYNHQLRGAESLRDEEFVRSFVQKCCPDVPLVVDRGDVSARAARDKTGIEETAREMRYAFLQAAAQKVGAQVIATAHNADDNAETMLLHLLRGSGLRGLAGIPPRRDNIVRPLLTTRRCDIEEYLQLYGLPHVEDSSNADERFARNRVRRQLMPLLREMQPQFTSHMGQTARLLARDEEYLAQQAALALPAPQTIPGGLSAHAPSIAAQPDALAARMVRLLLDRVTGRQYSAAHLTALIALCRSTDPSARLSLPNGLTARRVYDRLELTILAAPPAPAPCPLSVPGQTQVDRGVLTVTQTVYTGQPQQPEAFYLSRAKTQPGLTLRTRAPGDTLARPGRPRRTLKKIMVDEKLPRHLRAAVPVLECGGQIAGVPGLGPDVCFLPADGEACIYICFTQHQRKGTDEHEK